MNQGQSSPPRQHGGRRPGAGRPKGSASAKTREIADKAAASGVTPLEVMLKAMESIYTKACELDGTEEGAKAMQLAASVAKDAAPYIHPRLASVEHKGVDDTPLTIAVNFVQGHGA